jgi:hypothetical protein
MHQNEQIAIGFSKSKLTKLIAFSLFFALAGIWILLKDPKSDLFLLNEPIIRYPIAILALVMGGIAVFYFSKKLVNKTPALIIDAEGIIDQTTAFSVGRIYWNEIASFGETTIAATMFSKQKYVTVMPAETTALMERTTQNFKKNALNQNLKTYGFLCAIATGAIATNLTELKQQLDDALKKYKN